MKLTLSEKRALLKEKIKILGALDKPELENHRDGRPSERFMQLVRLDQIERLLKT